MPSEARRVPWRRWVVEFVLILGSVYLAVFLEGASQARSEASAARQALGQLLGELRQDRTDFGRILAVQENLNQTYLDLARWLRDPSLYPVDSLGAAIYKIGAENLTFFPRKASWNTMISGGQLAALDDPALVLRLGHLYETVYPRIDYNSSFYDSEVNAVFRATDVVRWTELETRPLVDDRAAIEELGRMLGRVHRMWNLWYRDLLAGYQDELEDAVSAVEDYLGEYER